MPVIFYAALGGALGAAARYLVNVGAPRLFGHDFPWATFIVNVAGSFAMGLLIGLMALKWNAGTPMRTFLATGVLGGFTTFSAFSLDFATLIERKAHAMAGLYAAGSVGLSIAAVFAGLALARTVLA